MRMPDLVEPGSGIKSRGIDHECVVAIPVAYRIPIKSGIRCALCVDLLGKFPSVHPDLAPDPLLLEEHEHTVRHLLEPDSASAIHRMIPQVAGKTQRIASHIRAVSGAHSVGISSRSPERRNWLIELEDCLGRRRHSREGT